MSDGRTAVGHPVLVTVEEIGLHVTDVDSRAAEIWPFACVALRDEELRQARVRLGWGDARLTVDDAAFAKALAAAAPQLFRPARRRVLYGGAATLVLLATITVLWWKMPAMSAALAGHVPRSWEIALGEQIDSQLWPGERCSSPAGDAALQVLTRRLARSDSAYPLTVSVRNIDMVNAFALPGGRIILLRGLLTQAQSPDEVAGVLAHELTHTLKRHPTRMLISNAGISLLFELTVGNGTGASFGAMMVTLSYTRAMEAEADEGAVALLRRAGIGTDGFAHFFERLAKIEEKHSGAFTLLPAYFRSHPPTEERLAAVRGQGQRGSHPALSPAEWNALRAICPSDKK